MTCDDARDMFSLLADDALTPLERAALDAHLADCAECRRELAGFERTVKLVRAIDPANAPAGFVERVLAAAHGARPAPVPQAPPSPQRAAPPSRKPTPTPQQPAPTPQQPMPTPEQPTRTPQQPTPTPQQPAPTPQQPTPTPQQPMPTPQQPTPTPQQPAPSPQRPTPLQERPARVPAQPPDRPLSFPERRRARRTAWTVPLGAAALFVIGGLAVLLFRSSPELQHAAQRQLEAPPTVTTPAPPSEAPPPAPATPSRDELQKPATQKPAAPASKPPKTATKPPTATGKRAETTTERKTLPDEQRNVAPPQSVQRYGVMESSERTQEKDKRDIAQEPLKGRSDAAPAPAQDAIQPAPASPSRDRQAATAKTQTSPLSRTGPATGIPAAAPDVTAKLHVADVRSGERALIALATRVGGRQTGRRVDAGRIVVELAVPLEAYPTFVRDAAALGSMSIERQDATDRTMLAVAVTLSR